MSKTGIFLIGGLIALAIVYQVIARIPSDALNVAVGVALGIVATVPITAGLLIALMRQRQRDEQPEWSDVEPEPIRYAPRQSAPRVQPAPLNDLYASLPPQQQQQQPQIIVIAPPQGQFQPGQFPQGLQLPPQWANQQYPFMQENAETIDARDWRIIGED